MYEVLVFGSLWFWLLLLAEFAALIYMLEDENYGGATVSIILVLLGCYFFGDLQNGALWAWSHKYITLALFAGYFILIGTPYALVKWWSFVHRIREKNRKAKAEWLENWQKEAARFKERTDSLQLQLKAIKERADSEVLSCSQNLPPNSPAIKARIKSATESTAKQISDYENQITESETAYSAWFNSNGVMTSDLLPFWKQAEKDITFFNFCGKRISIVKPEPDKHKGRIISWIVYWPPSMFWTLLNDPIRQIGRMIYNMIAGTLKKISNSVWKDEDSTV